MRVTSPSASCVLVLTPSTISKRYTLSKSDRNSANRVARPKHSTIKPDASGSKVPVCPTRLIFSCLRTHSTKSWAVIPEGFNSNSTPSGS